MDKTIGICLGASTITAVAKTSSEKEQIFRRRHGGNPKETLKKLLRDMLPNGGKTKISITGRKLRESVRFPQISEPEAISEFLKNSSSKNFPEAIVSFGGQSILVYLLDKTGRIVNSCTFNKCASGTGEFFLQQIKRLDFENVEKAVEGALKKESYANPYVPASRCSVFCKSDCTHATNEGKATRGQIANGLCLMIAKKIAELLGKNQVKNIWLIGGGSQIKPVILHLDSLGFNVEIPKEAQHMEALGAYFFAQKNKPVFIPKEERDLFNKDKSSFSILPPLKEAIDLVEMKNMPKSKAQAGDECLLAVDAGSTTTKLVLIRLKDMGIISSYYGYTLGKPHLATIEGLKHAQKEIGTQITIKGISVTGSGRYLVETFLTDFKKKTIEEKLIPQVVAINEIVCHATAAEYFNPGVGTVLEIGGQDAKYTSLSHGVPIDFVMNEACSAGTGSFLAEVVKEMFGIKNPAQIAPSALKGEMPVKFGEQCSAFIEGDINIALQEGATQPDVLAGLNYSICFNFLNRVVGNRPIVGPVSIQGGTAYNLAFCYAMATVLKMNGSLRAEEKVVVNKEAGLLGAIGAGLELKKKIDNGQYTPITTDLEKLLKKQLKEGKTFNCHGCDYKCKIQNFIIDGTKVPFGGYCRRWDCVRRQEKEIDPSKFDLTVKRDELLLKKFSDYGNNLSPDAPTIGLLGTFFELTYMPFLTTLFSQLGYRVILADKVDPEGLKKQGAAFCYPMEKAHGLFANLITKKPDFYWLPQIKGIKVRNIGDNANNCCPFVQGIGFTLATAFRDEVDTNKIINPYLDLSGSEKQISKQLREEFKGKRNISSDHLKTAVAKATQKQRIFEAILKYEGKKILEGLENNPDKIAFVLFGRPYNSFSGRLNANKGISRKAASLGIPIIPLDFLPIEDMEPEEDMYWPTGQQNLKGARFVKNHPQLFALYLTNFSCGPDGFMNFKFRHYMGKKPSLTLEFDGHTANAGFDTRIEAFFDIVKGWRLANKPKGLPVTRQSYSDTEIDLRDPNAKLVIPDMGRFNTEAIAEVVKSFGINAVALPPGDEECLKIGRRHSSCKECLPYNITLGMLLQYLENRPSNEKTVFLMASASGPCRFGQYNSFMKLITEKLNIKNCNIISPNSQDGYRKLGKEFQKRGWLAIVTSSAFTNIENSLLSLAVDPKKACEILEKEWQKIKEAVRSGVDLKNFKEYKRLLKEVVNNLAKIPLKQPFSQSKKVLITGEIYVRMAELTVDQMKQELIESGFVPFQAPVTEWIKYIDYIIEKNIYPECILSIAGKFKHKLKLQFQAHCENAIYDILSQSGLMDDHTDKIENFVSTAKRYVSPKLNGETILTVGSSMHDVFTHFCGVVVVGPFGCMPTRLASSILFYTMNAKGKLNGGGGSNDPKIVELTKKFPHCPHLVFEADGGPLPPITQSQLETFKMVSMQVGEEMIRLS